MAAELTPKERPEAFQLLIDLRNLAKSLRKFLDTEEYAFFEESLHLYDKVKNHSVYQHLSGHLDLDNNLNQLRSFYEATGGKMDDNAFGRMLDQVVYTIVRINIVATGLEFKLKRMRKG